MLCNSTKESEPLLELKKEEERKDVFSDIVKEGKDIKQLRRML